jgi:hypothetical protein
MLSFVVEKNYIVARVKFYMLETILFGEGSIWRLYELHAPIEIGSEPYHCSSYVTGQPFNK